MDHISNHLPDKPQTSNQLTTYSAQSVTTYSDPEAKIIELKYQSPQIAKLENLETWGKALMVKIHIITGWVLPESSLMSIFIDQFTKKLIEDYSHLNVDEIEYAFRSIGTGVKDWGKSMNLSLIDEVLTEYVYKRFELSKIEERAKEQPIQRIYTLEELDDIHRGHVEAFYQRCLKGIIPPPELPEYYLTILIKDGYMAEGSDDLHGFFAYWLNKGYKHIYKR